MKNQKIVTIIAVAVVILVGFFLFMNRQNTSTSSQSSTNEPTKVQNSPMIEVTPIPNMVAYTDNGFSPASLTVKAGTVVTWKNESAVSAQINSDPHPTHTNYPPLNLGVIASGQTLSLKFDKPGTYGYHNHLDSSQKGTIIVQ